MTDIVNQMVGEMGLSREELERMQGSQVPTMPMQMPPGPMTNQPPMMAPPGPPPSGMTPPPPPAVDEQPQIPPPHKSDIPKQPDYETESDDSVGDVTGKDAMDLGKLGLTGTSKDPMDRMVALLKEPAIIAILCVLVHLPAVDRTLRSFLPAKLTSGLYLSAVKAVLVGALFELVKRLVLS